MKRLPVCFISCDIQEVFKFWTLFLYCTAEKIILFWDQPSFLHFTPLRFGADIFSNIGELNRWCLLCRLWLKIWITFC